MDSQLKRRRFWPDPNSTCPIPFVPEESEDLLVISTPSPGVRHIGIIMRGLMECQPWPRRILISSYGEPADHDFLEALNSIAHELEIADRIAVYDAGKHINGFNHLKTIIYSPWWFAHTVRMFNQQPIPFEQRALKFSCLNRIARLHRIKLVEKIIEEGLLEQGLVTCGSATPDYDFDRTCQPEYRHLFPLDPLNDLTPMGLNGESDFDATLPNHSMMNAIVNLVSESSYERLMPFKECWEREMTTEKTVKTYLSEQIPIWLAPAFFVNYQTQLGFDIFDDLIDHSYDSIVDPYKRIDAIAAELKRVMSKSIEELRDFCIKNQHRFTHNRELAVRLAQQFTDESTEQFKNWLA